MNIVSEGNTTIIN